MVWFLLRSFVTYTTTISSKGCATLKSSGGGDFKNIHYCAHLTLVLILLCDTINSMASISINMLYCISHSLGLCGVLVYSCTILQRWCFAHIGSLRLPQIWIMNKLRHVVTLSTPLHPLRVAGRTRAQLPCALPCGRFRTSLQHSHTSLVTLLRPFLSGHSPMRLVHHVVTSVYYVSDISFLEGCS